MDREKPPLSVYAVILVSFDHALGPTVEWSYPASLAEHEALSQQINRNLPFLALPDGAHLKTEDYSYFHLFLPHLSTDSTIFGISCNRQIVSTDLINPGADVTRSTVQKAVVVLANQPVFGCIRDKLGVVTRALFAQRDFTDRSILEDFYHSLAASFKVGLGEGGGEVTMRLAEPTNEQTYPSSSASSTNGTVDSTLDPEQEARRLEALRIKKGKQKERSGEAAMYMGTNLRELIHHFRLKTLQLVKLLLLQRRIMFYGHPVESLCTYQYSLVSLIPCLLVNLEDSGSPMLAERSRKLSQPTSLQTSDRHSLLKYFGLPLDIFGQDSFFQPYLPLQQIDLLKASTYLVGTTNTIFQQQKDCKIDAIANIELATLELKDPKLASLIALTSADRKWMDELIEAVDSSWNEDDPSRPIGNKFLGSDDYLRREFENYVCSILSVIKYADYCENSRGGGPTLGNNESANASVAAFNDVFIQAFKTTHAFKLWDKHTDSVIFDLIDPRHPCEGRVSVVEDVGIWLSHGIKDLKLDETLSKSSESVWKLASSIRTDFAKRQAEYKEKSNAQIAAASLPKTAEVATGADAKAAAGDSNVDGEEKEGAKDHNSDHSAEPQPIPSRASSIATSFSSFFFGTNQNGETSTSTVPHTLPTAKTTRPMSVGSATPTPDPKNSSSTATVSPIQSFFRYS
ncbi:late secretory pathway protein avl9 [Puccinia graminis f. sp. tritici]|uniref:Late secretory pathway protein avl9 n=1 Tax=Puccinia graminis f. sp. tritici TaxID=56615 RepID=A0A5B0MKF6_PUCGR|nr:late secretory pathway protein avl9 [Puccinia graminis f. sp. tritici]